jgi:hypothetical protein
MQDSESKGLIVGLVIALASVSTHAIATITCSPTAVNSDKDSNITMYCGGEYYYGQPGRCGASLNSVKMWLSLIQAAKNLEFNLVEDSGCANYLNWVQLWK